eukprot:Awhi_evm1s11933
MEIDDIQQHQLHPNTKKKRKQAHKSKSVFFDQKDTIIIGDSDINNDSDEGDYKKEISNQQSVLFAGLLASENGPSWESDTTDGGFLESDFESSNCQYVPVPSL